MQLIIKLVKLCLGLASLITAFYFRTPLLASLRIQSFALIIIIGLGLIFSELNRSKNGSVPQRSWLNFVIIAIAAFSISATVSLEVKFNLTKQRVLHQDSSQLATLGQHFIIGYRDEAELKTLINKQAIGGVFITRRNIQNKTKNEIKHLIESLQNLRSSQGLSPLWIATDQEGGIVSRLSPPLTQLPPLSAIIAGGERIEEKKDQVIEYATIQAKELAEIGVNLNFAPVVDLNKGLINPKDQYSQIYLRAISTDKNVVAKVALWYCQTLQHYGVECTIKHFPGLGRVYADTHLNHGELVSSIEELTQDDWIPFREVMQNSRAFTMLGHAQLIAIDPQHPVSFSPVVVRGLIRNTWQHDGILITDDFSMQAVYSSPDGIKNATIKAINGGVDLILIAYDTDLYYEAMDAVLKAQKIGHLDRETQLKSQRRLEVTKKSLAIGYP